MGVNIMNPGLQNLFNHTCFPKNLILDYRKATLSSQICNEETTREEAIEALKLPIYNEEDMEREKDLYC